MTAGLYLHVPFCRHVCSYCDFNAHAGSDGDERARYAAALRADLSRVAAAGPAAVAPPSGGGGAAWPEFTSVFVGGGTPTQLDAGDLAGLLRHARALLPVAADAEVTVEANPEDVTVEYVGELVGAGLTRLSLGAQSFAPHVLGFLDRGHDRERPLRAVADARTAGVEQVNLDLIYGAPAERTADWDDSLRTAAAAGTEHVSAYALTLEPNTGYAAEVRAGRRAAPDDDVAAERMAAADAALTAAGLERYEISNWARPGRRSRHNLVYWRGGDWLGVGAGAHGHWSAVGAATTAVSRRWWSLRHPRRYAEAALAGLDTTAGSELLDAAARRRERLLMGLRLHEGVAREEVEPVDEAQVVALTGAGLLRDDGRRLALADRGRPLAGAVILRLLP